MHRHPHGSQDTHVIEVLLPAGEMREVLVLELAAECLGPEDVDGPAGLGGAAARSISRGISPCARARAGHMHLRDGVHGVHRQPVRRVEGREQHLREVVGACEQRRFA